MGQGPTLDGGRGANGLTCFTIVNSTYMKHARSSESSSSRTLRWAAAKGARVQSSECRRRLLAAETAVERRTVVSCLSARLRSS
jgi:hypothetical protein